MLQKSLAVLLGAVAAAGMGLSALAQPPAGPPAGRGPAATPKPGYVAPPEMAGGRYAMNGEPIFREKCAACHEPAMDRAPSRKELEGRSPEDIYEAITNGVMKPMAEGLSEAQRFGVVYFLTGKSPTPRMAQGPDANPCKVSGPLQPNGPQWNGWGVDIRNTRFQPKPGFAAADAPRLKVKWAFSYRGAKNSQATIFGDRVFVASLAGPLYSLDAKSGCVHWRVDVPGGARASITVAPLASAPSKYAIYVGDDRMWVHAYDAGSGKELWKLRTDDHKLGRITGTPTLYNGLLYVTLSSAEENMGNQASYGCCTFRGQVVAVDAKTGKQVWKTYVIDEAPHPTRKNAAGTQMYGPAGGAIWSSPTIDVKRGQLYVTTGDSYTEIDEQASDSVIAMDLKSGKIRWISQVLDKDNYISARGVNAPLGVIGPDFDFGAHSQIVTTPEGKEIVVTGNKSSIVYGMDPDTGKILWQTKLGSGSALGGVEFGPATDGKTVWVANADGANGKPGLFALDGATGKEVWHFDSPKGLPCGVPSGRCGVGFSQAVSAMPGLVFSGGKDGRLRAFTAADGKLVWQYDTTAPIDTVNGIKGAVGGSLDMSGPTIGGGMVFVHSGYLGDAGANNLLLAFGVDGK
ncbi:PQQ-binding-like beta-propeller repeat protein [soil metagenome]